MPTVTRTAFDPETEQEYEIEMPAPEEVGNAILELEFPPEGIRMKDAVDPLAENLRLTDGQRRAEISSGLTVFHYRIVHPAFQNLLREGALVQPNGKGTPYCLTQTTPRPPNSDPVLDSDPPVPIEEPYQGIRKKLEETLLEELRDIDPTVFEKLVVDLISKMGYGTGEHIGGVGDGGFDGTITDTDDDRLGLYKIYIQAKRQDASVQKPAIRRFEHDLRAERGKMGIFVTTSRFTSGAREFAENTVDPKIVLVDGKQLARLLLKYNVFHG